MRPKRESVDMSEFDSIVYEVTQKTAVEQMNAPHCMTVAPVDPLPGKPNSPHLRMIAWDKS